MKILQIAPRPPYPPVDGGSLCAHNFTQGLLRQGHQVKLLAFHSHKHPCDLKLLPKEYVEKTRFETIFVDLKLRWHQALKCLLKGYSYHVKRFESRAISERIAHILRDESFDIIQLEGLYLTPYLPVFRKYSDAKVVLRSHNVEHLIWQRIARGTKNPIKKIYLKQLTHSLKTYELKHLNAYDGIVAITEVDAQIFRSNGCQKPLISIPFSIDFPDAVDISVEENSLCHLGSMTWMPNIEGIAWFLDKVWDKIHAEFPQVNLYLAGRGMPEKFLRIQKPNLKIIGEIDDGMHFICSKQIMIVPLLSGSGIRVKIIEGMSVGKTVIATTIAAEGIHYTDGKNILIANTPDEFLHQVRKCIFDHDFCRSIGTNAAALISSEYDIGSATAKLTHFYEHLLEIKTH